MSARELAAGALSEFPLARSVGLAALNALLPEPEGRITERNAGELAAERGAGRTVGVVGWFPFLPQKWIPEPSKSLGLPTVRPSIN